MKKINFLQFVPVPLVFAIILLSLVSNAYSSEVFYLGGGGQGDVGPQAAQPAKEFTWKDRVNDLVDFKRYGDYGPDRSGMITGSVMEDVSYNDVGGNGQKSFLKKGVFQNTEVNINAYEKLWADYNFEGEVFVRRTDDRRIETRKDLRLKQLTTRIYNPNNMLLFGDFYGDFSQFTMGDSLEGFYGELSPSEMITIKGIAARSQSPDNDMGTFWRNTCGGKTDIKLFQDSDLFSLFRVGAQGVSAQDDRGTADSTDRVTPISDLNNTVVSVDGEIRAKKYFSLLYEFARSANIYDENSGVAMDYGYGNAFRVMPGVKYGPLSFKYLFYAVDPLFYADSGSAMADKRQNQFTLDYAICKKAKFTFVENYYYDHLDQQSLQTMRTYYNEKYMTLSARPFDSDPSFNVRGYTNIQERDSDDIGNSKEAITITPGVGVNDMLDKQTSWGMFYEFRGYVDEFTKSNSDYFNRFGTNVGREQYLLGRRAYVSANFNIDFHDPKQFTKNEITTGGGFSGQYNFFADHMLYFGYNVSTNDSCSPFQNYFNNTTFGEVSLLMDKKRDARFILRAEYNNYDQQDRSQSYDETRIITKVVSNF